MSVRNLVKSIQDIMRQDVGVDGDAQRISQLCWTFFLKIIDDQDQQLEMMYPDYRSPIPKSLQWRTWAANPEGITGDELQTFVNAELFPRLKSLPASGKGQADRRRVVRDVFEDAYNYMKSGQLMRQVINKISAVDFNSRSEISLFPDSAGNKGRFAQPTVRFPIFGINDNMLVVVWGLGVLRRGSGEAPARLRWGQGGWVGVWRNNVTAGQWENTWLLSSLVGAAAEPHRRPSTASQFT